MWSGLLKTRIYFIISLFIFLCFIGLIFFNSLPYNPLHLKSSASKITLKSLLPESWGFFTRDPKEEKLYIYKYEAEAWVFDSKQKQTSLVNLMGFNRNAKKYLTIFGGVTSFFNWDSTYTTLNLLLSNTLEAEIIKIKNYDAHYIAPGKYLLVRKAIIPWSWRRYEAKIKERIYSKVLLFE